MITSKLLQIHKISRITQIAMTKTTNLIADQCPHHIETNPFIWNANQ